MPDIQDLDILRPEPKLIKLCGKKIDISFIPVGITFEVDRITRELGKFTVEELSTDPKKGAAGLDLTIKLCAAFVSHQHPELDEEWFRRNTTGEQIEALALTIRDLLNQSFEAVEAHSKN